MVPCLALGGLELALRVAGYGYPTRFFLTRRVNGQQVLVENDKFGLRFFPRGLARNPPPLVMPAQKPPGTYRIFLLGESAALGDPRPAYGMGRYLQVLLQERFPEARFEVVCVAMTAINSHAIRLIARECGRYQGDLWLVYMGHNEMVGPFGACTIFGPRAPTLGFIRVSLALKATRTGQLLDALTQRLRGRRYPNAVWQGLKMFLDNQVRADDPRRQIVCHHFEKNLDEIVRRGLNAGCHVILSTVASNLKDCGPFGSLHGPGLSPDAASEWATQYQTGKASEATGDSKSALAAYEKAVGLDPWFAELHFRVAQLQLRLTNVVQARSAFERARDHDTLPFRADSMLNAAVRRVAACYTNRPVHRAEAQEIMARQPNDTIPGSELFFEHVHLNFEGNYWLARGFAEAIESLLPEGMTRNKGPGWASPEACHRRLGLTDWNRYAACESILERTSDAPYTNQLTHVAQRQRLLAQMADLKPRLRSDAARQDALTLYREALLKAPQDYRLHENFAEFLEAVGDFKEATVQWQAVRDLLPHHFVAYVHAGRLLARRGNLREAQENLANALKVEPRSAEARLELGRLLAKQGKPEQAIAQYAEALRWQPGDARIHLEIAHALAQQEKRPEAMDELRQAILLRPSFWEARYLLGVELAVNNMIPEAQTEFEQVIQLRPDHVLARLNLGVALVRQGKVGEAQRQFQEVLRLDPQNPKAKQHLETLEGLLKDAESQK